MRVRVKICGITRLEDVLSAVRAGADAVGFVFHRSSPRYVSPEKAGEIARELPPFVDRVGVFVDAEPAQVYEVAELARLSVLQFHGHESPDYCTGWALPVVKAFRVGPEFSPADLRAFREVAAVLLDGYHGSAPGGTGTRCDWETARRVARERCVVLAGGLTPENVAEAVRTVRPYAVDVSSGVEVKPGIKDPVRVAAFVRAVRRACEELSSES